MRISDELSSANPVPVSSQVGAPIAANVLAGRQSFTTTTAATTIITIPAGRTWHGRLTASVSCSSDGGVTTAPVATATFTTAGAGVTPSAGTYFVVSARNGANVGGGAVGVGGNNFGSVPFTVIAPVGNSVTIQVASANAGTVSLVDASAVGVLL